MFSLPWRWFERGSGIGTGWLERAQRGGKIERGQGLEEKDGSSGCGHQHCEVVLCPLLCVV